MKTTTGWEWGRRREVPRWERGQGVERENLIRYLWVEENRNEALRASRKNRNRQPWEVGGRGML